jgi:hypothetical protein
MGLKEKFIKKAKLIHNDKYDYSKVEYINSKIHICIICPKHGEFYQTPAAHIRGDGCPRCALSRNGSIPRLSTQEFIEKARKIHGDRYDYSRVNYINYTTKVEIICEKHGSFHMTPLAHLSNQNCPKCQGKGLTNDEWIERFKEIHGNKYDYSKMLFKSTREKVCIICPKHGEFYQSPSKHLIGRGCPKCAVEIKQESNKLGNERFIERANIIHNNKYDYSKVIYTNAHAHVTIICPKHGEFKQRAYDHLHGHGCPICSQSHLEREISILLDKMRIDYIRQFKSKILAKMSLDFYLPQYNIAIECQGIQHFQPVVRFGGEKEWKRVIERDIKKSNICKDHNINLIYFKNEHDLISPIIEFLYSNKNTFSSIHHIEKYIEKWVKN